MPEQLGGTQAGAGTAGTGAAAPAVPQAQPPAAAPPGPQAGRPEAVGGGASPGSLGGETVGQSRHDIEVKLSNQGRELADLKRQLAERAAAQGRPPEGAPPQAPASPGGVGEPSAYAKNLYEWATRTYRVYEHGYTWMEPDKVNPETGETVRGTLQRIDPDDEAAVEHARIQEAVLRPLGFTKFPWSGKYDFSRGGSAPQAAGVLMTQEQLNAWYEQKRQETAISDLDVDEQFDESLKAVGEARKLGPDFFAARADVGSGRTQTRERVIGRVLAREGLQPTPANVERVVLTLFHGDLWTYQQQQAYSAGVSQRRDDAQGLGVPGLTRNTPFPETPADQQKLAAFKSVNDRVGDGSSFGGKPANLQQEVVYDDGRGRPG